MNQESATDPFTSRTINSMRRDFTLNLEYNSQYVLSDFTPMLNCALAGYYGRDQETAKRIAYDYLVRYESVSAWATLLRELVGVKLPSPATQASYAVFLPAPGRPESKAVTAGDNIETLVNAWGRPDSIAEAGDDTASEYWSYASLGAAVVIEGGEIIRIPLSEGSRLQVNRLFGPGASREQVEKSTGPCKRYADSYAVYEGAQVLAVMYVLGKSAEISVFTPPGLPKVPFP
jgi:hypothetical protein